MPRPPEGALSLAHRLADASGAVIRRHFRTSVPVEAKADATPVTAADREAELAMRALIESAFPEHGILGEEHGVTRGEAEYVWLLDPIDGTKSFISGIPLFGTLIALTQRAEPILGVIDQPILGERWVGQAGEGTTLNGAPARARPCDTLGRATLFATAPDMFEGADAGRFDRLAAEVGLVRHGADCYGYAMLASGHVDLVVEAGLKDYDFAALVPVIEGAGGVVTDWQGRPMRPGADGRIVAAGDARLHRAALAVLAA